MNQAFQLLTRGLPPAEVVTRMAAELGASARQVARYVQAAQRQGELQIPEAKEAFTVKLPSSLIKRVRKAAAAEHNSISNWVAQALDRQLGPPRRHG